MKERLVLEDIAQALGVSKTTVSRAISGTGRISEGTRKRVLDYVAKTGFVPNATASTLATMKTQGIAYSMPLGDSSLTSTYFLECLFGVSQVAAEAGYHVVIVDDNIDVLYRTAGGHKVDALIMSIFNHGDEAMHKLVDYGMPIVLTGNSKVPSVLTIGYDGEKAYSELTEYLLDKWQCPMALLLTNEGYVANISRAEGYLAAMQRRGIQDPVLCWDVIGNERLLEVVTMLYRKGIRGIIGCDEAIINGLLPILNSFAVSSEPTLQRMAREIKVASFHSNKTLRDFHPEVPTIVVDPMEMGKAAARAAIQEIGQSGTTAAYTEVPYRIHHGS